MKRIIYPNGKAQSKPNSMLGEMERVKILEEKFAKKAEHKEIENFILDKLTRLGIRKEDVDILFPD